MKRCLRFVVSWLIMVILIPAAAWTQSDDPNIDNTAGMVRPPFLPRTGMSSLLTVTTQDGYDNFDLGVDFAEPHMSTHPTNPLWWFNAFNTNGTHHTENGIDWGISNPTFPSVNGDPVTAYDSLGNLYYMTMNGPSITGTWVVKSTNNGQTWGTPVASNPGNDKNWLAADQTMGPYANYVYGTMTNSATGSFTRSTDQGATFAQTWTFTTQSLPGMMVCVGPNVLGGNNVSGGCVYVVTNSGSSFASTYTFYNSTDGGLTFTLKSTQNFSNYVGTNVGGRNSVQNMRTRPYPFVTADNSFGTYRGRLYLVYASNNPVGDGNKPDIYCRYSTNQGATWSLPVTINDDAGSEGNHQWHPSTWCDKETGRLYVKWLDTRNTPTSDSCEVYAAYSDDGGTTWTPNQKLSNAKMKIDCPTCGGGGTPRYQGDYDAISSNKNGAMAVWTDFRNGSFLSMVGYFPDFAMQLSTAADTVGLTDSVTVTVRVPSVKLYSKYVKFSASSSPASNMTFSFLNNKDSLTTYPDSVGLKIRTNGTAQGVYTITVVGRGPDGAAVHKRTMTLSVLPRLVQVLQPNGGEQMFAGTTYPISWAKNEVDSVRLEYSAEGPTGPWILIASGIPAAKAPIVHPKLRGLSKERDNATNLLGTYAWRVPSAPSSNCFVRISDAATGTIFDVSNGAFSIVAAPAPRWTDQNSGTAAGLYSVSVVDTSVAWAAGDSGRTYRTVNGGGSWLARATAGFDISSISALSSNIALATSNGPNNARILRTANGGLSWTAVYQDTASSAYFDAVKMFDANNGFAVGDPVQGQWRLLKTTNGGTTWTNAGTLASSGSEYGWSNSLAWIGQNGWFGTNNNRVYRTTDGGANWSSAATSFTNSYAVSFASATVGMASGGGVARTSDGGSSWSDAPALPPNAPFGSAAVPLSPARWYVVAGGDVYKSMNHGGSWNLDFSQSNPYQAIDLKVVTVGGNSWLTGYAVGDTGTVSKYIELLVDTDVRQRGDGTPGAFALDQNFPNPFNPSTKISYEIPERATVTLRIFDVLGREVRTLVRGEKAAGIFESVWDGTTDSGLQTASGVYFYKLEVNMASGEVKTSMKRMVLIK
jgi:photosystem II stability/assembly factor-like uncharacterized protein